MCNFNRDDILLSTHRGHGHTLAKGATARAEALGLRATTVDGNDAMVVADVTAEITARIRAGGGPEMLHAITYRSTGHTSFDPAGYRPEGESEHETKTNDPIARQRAVLAGMGLSADDLDAVHTAAQSEMVQVLADAAATPFPADDMALQDVQDIGSPAQEA